MRSGWFSSTSHGVPGVSIGHVGDIWPLKAARIVEKRVGVVGPDSVNLGYMSVVEVRFTVALPEVHSTTLVTSVMGPVEVCIKQVCCRVTGLQTLFLW